MSSQPQHTDREGRRYDLTAPALPDLAPGEMRTTLPERWCAKCEQLRPKRTCAVCGCQTEAPPAHVLEHISRQDAQPRPTFGPPTADVLKHIVENVPVHVVELDAAGNNAAAAAAALSMPGDPDDDLEPAEDDDEAPDELEEEDDELDGLTVDVPADEPPKGLGLVARLAAAQRTRATQAHVAVEDLTRRELLIATRPKGPIARGIEERSRPRAWQPLSDRTTRRNQPMTARPMHSRNRDLDERGREVQRTEGRAKTRSVEDQLIGLWEGAKIDLLTWNQYFAAAMQQPQFDEAGKPYACSPEDAADLADQMYLQLLIRQKYATA